MDRLSELILTARSELRVGMALLKMRKEEEKTLREEQKAKALSDKLYSLMKSKNSLKERYKDAQFNKAYY